MVLGLPVVQRQHLGDVAGVGAGLRGDDLCRATVELAASAERQQVVGGIPDEAVPEPDAAVGFDPKVVGELLVDPVVEADALRCEELVEQGLLETDPEDRSEAKHPTGVSRQAVDLGAGHLLE